MGSVKGWFRVEEQLVSGWASDTSDPDHKSCVEVVVGGRSVGRVRADRFEPKVGDTGFAFFLNEDSIRDEDVVSVVHAKSGAPLKSKHVHIKRSAASGAPPLTIKELRVGEQVEIWGRVGSYPKSKILNLELWSAGSRVASPIPVEWTDRANGLFRATLPSEALAFVWHEAVEIALPGLKESGLGVALDHKPIHAIIKQSSLGIGIELISKCALVSSLPVAVAFTHEEKSFKTVIHYDGSVALIGWPADIPIDRTTVEVLVGGVSVQSFRVRELPVRDPHFLNVGRKRTSDWQIGKNIRAVAASPNLSTSVSSEIPTPDHFVHLSPASTSSPLFIAQNIQGHYEAGTTITTSVLVRAPRGTLVTLRLNDGKEIIAESTLATDGVKEWTEVTLGGEVSRTIDGTLHFEIGCDQAPLEGLDVAVPDPDDILLACHASYAEARLTVLAQFSREIARSPTPLLAEVLAGTLVLQRTELQLMDEECRAELNVLVSRRTLGLGLSLSIPALGLSWPIGMNLGAGGESEVAAPALFPFADHVEGSLNGITLTAEGVPVVHGWARDHGRPGEAVVIDLFVDGAPVSSGFASGNRPDVAKKLGGSAICGFVIELPSNMGNGELLTLDARARARKSDLKGSPNQARMFPNGEVVNRHSRALKPTHHLGSQGAKSLTAAGIILTQDGAEVLEPLLQSICAFEPDTFRRLIVIDHGSADGTADVVAKFSNRLPIELIERPRDSSFSESNNFAAKLCSEDLLFFINNDLLFTSSVCHQLASQWSSDTGMVGVKLMDPPLPHSAFGLQAPQHVGIHFTSHANGNFRAFESRFLTDCSEFNHAPVAVPAVTAALAVVARDFFEEVGGFDERYFYGMEDVVLCLRAIQHGKVNVSVNNLSVVHLRGYSRRRMPAAAVSRRKRNAAKFLEEWQYSLGRSVLQDLMDRPGFWSGRKINIGFVVSEVGPEASAGDYMTALDFSRAFQRVFPAKSFFFDRRQSVDAREIDLLFVMIDGFDVRGIVNLGRTTLLIAWARNWFHRWAARPWRERFDLWFASSKLAVDYLQIELGRSVGLLPIGTDTQRFSQGTYDPSLAADVTFTGHNWGVPRDISAALNVDGYSLRIFGNGWDTHPRLAGYAHGPINYDRMPDVYKSCRIVIDDSNFVTASWASVNSRVFDAVAAGALVLTNNVLGSEEIFEGKLPVYKSPDDLQKLIADYLGDEDKRKRLVAELRDMVTTRHSYESRSAQFHETMSARVKSGLRVAIKISTPSVEKSDGWGDWYFANSLRRELENLGHSVRIDCLGDWRGQNNGRDDANIVLRGLDMYRPDQTQINLLWLISHPHKVAIEELEGYDHVYVASEPFADHLTRISRVPITFLPQCTDASYRPVADGVAARAGVVFVANSRGVMRPVAESILRTGAEVDVFGGGWSGLLPEELIQANTIPNEDVLDLYRGAEIVLNDHWDDMREAGFMSNRMFDAVACGAVVLSDRIAGAEELFGKMVRHFDDPESFAAAIAGIRTDPPSEADRLRAAEQVTSAHSFRARAILFDRVLRDMDAARNHLNQLKANKPRAAKR